MPRFTQPHPGLGLDWSNPINDEVIGYWPFLEGGGPTLRDYSGRGYDGTLTTMDPATDWVVGPNGHALDFDGTSDYVDISSFEIPLGPFSVAVRCWCDGYGSNSYPGPLKLQTANSAQSWNIVFSETGAYAGISFGAADADIVRCKVNDYASVPLGEWIDLVITFNGGAITSAANFEAFVNGVHKGADLLSSAYSWNTEPSEIGIEGANYWDGKISSVAILNRALHGSEVAQLYADPWARWRSPSTSVFVPAAPAGGRIMGSLVGQGGLVGPGGIISQGGGLVA